MPPRTSLPPPLPPETRTVGQLVAEALKLYGARFWPALALGVGPGIFGVADSELGGAARVIFDVLVGPLVFAAASYSRRGCAREAHRARSLRRRRAGYRLPRVPADLPGKALQRLPGINLMAVAWLAFFCLAVPAALVEQRGFLDALRRGVATRPRGLHPRPRLTRDASHHDLPDRSRVVLLVACAEQTRRCGRGAAGTTSSSLRSSCLGAAILYVDQEARVESSPRPRREARCRRTFCFRV